MANSGHGVGNVEDESGNTKKQGRYQILQELRPNDSEANLNEFSLAKDAWSVRITTSTEYNLPNVFKPQNS